MARRFKRTELAVNFFIKKRKHRFIIACCMLLLRAKITFRGICANASIKITNEQAIHITDFFPSSALLAGLPLLYSSSPDGPQCYPEGRQPHCLPCACPI
jgi:hypothetical protein